MNGLLPTDIVKIATIITITVISAIPLGRYIYCIVTSAPSFADPVMDRVDRLVYRLAGIDRHSGMNWKQYSAALLLTNAVMCILLFAVLILQGILPLNPNKIGSMEPFLALNTTISFITNTNLQDYSGENGVSYLSQMLLTFMMFVAPASGLAAAAAFMRGVTGNGGNSGNDGKDGSLGNYFADMTRFITRLLLPLSIAASLFYTWQGVPQTFSPNRLVTTLEGGLQAITLGPVASLEAVKNLASNGGGFFGANSAHPFENPTPLTDAVTIIFLGLISVSLLFTFAKMARSKRLAVTILVPMLLLLIATVAITYSAESAGNPQLAGIGLSQAMGNMEGKEVRFGIAESSLFAASTTAYQVGAVNAAHDSLMPSSGLSALWNMMLQTVFGGKGTGLIYMVMYVILTVFLCGLMAGRTPEFLGRKIQAGEMKPVAITILLHPLLILIPAAIALSIPSGTESVTNPGYHGFSQILYQYTSSAANNGSGFEGLLDNTPFWNITTAAVMLLGRYIPIVAMLAVAGGLSIKKATPFSAGTLRTDSPIFAVLLLFIIMLVGALTFLPALVMGPIAEQLSLGF